MAHYYYAQIDPDTGFCFAVSQTNGQFNQPNMIELQSYDTELIGKMWSDGAWSSPTPPNPD